MDDSPNPQATPPFPPAPEAGGRLLLGWILVVMGAVMLFVGWLGVSKNPQVAVQLSYFVSGGLGGVLAGIVGIGLLVSDDVRKDRARLGRLESAVLEMRDLVAAQAQTIRELTDALESKPEPDEATRRRASGR